MLGAVTAVLVVAALGLVVEMLFLRRFAARPLAQMMLTMGFALVFRDAAFMIWGGDPFTLPYPPALRGSLEAADIVFPAYRLFVVAVAAGVGVLLWLLNEKTLLPWLRAAVDDPEMAAGSGINVALLSGLVFAAGAGLAAFGGVMGDPFSAAIQASISISASGLCRRHHRRHGQPERRAGRQHRRGHDRQFRQGAGARAVVFHVVRADGHRPRAQADRVVWSRVRFP